MIRLALVTDLQAINAFDIFAGNRLLEVVDNHMFVSETDNQVVGYVSWLPKGFIGHNFISYLGVDPRCQRRGHGRALLHAAQAAIGSGRIYVSADENNSTMLAFLPVEGWTFAGQVAGVHEHDRAELFFYKDHCLTGDTTTNGA